MKKKDDSIRFKDVAGEDEAAGASHGDGDYQIIRTSIPESVPRFPRELCLWDLREPVKPCLPRL